MEEHPTYLVYTHIPEFIENRSLTLLENSEYGLNEPKNKFISTISIKGYVKIQTFDTEDNRIDIFIFAPGGKYVEKGPDLQTLISSNIRDIAEMILIVPMETIEKKNIETALGKFPEEIVKMYPYSVFSFNLPKCESIPLHEILSPEETEELLMFNRVTFSDLRKIRSIDPPLVWIGAKPRDVVKVTAPSETAGHVIEYYAVV